MNKHALKNKTDTEIIAIVESPDTWTPEMIARAKMSLSYRTIDAEKVKDIARQLYRKKCDKALDVSGFSPGKIKAPYSQLLSKNERRQIMQDALEYAVQNRQDLYGDLSMYTYAIDF